MSPRGAYSRARPAVSSTLGSRIRAIRVKWRWSQGDLAKAIGSDQRTLSSWERDKYPVPGPVLELLAALFKVRPEALRSGQGFKIPDPIALGAAEQAIPYLALPPQAEPGLCLIDRKGGTHGEHSVTQVMKAVRQAQKDGRPVWVVIG